jgi:hypothetical protein
MNWHGYVLILKPAALSLADWRTSALAMAQYLGKLDDDPSPSLRMHTRIRPDNQAVILEAMFDDDDLDISQMTRGIVAIIYTALEGAYTRQAIRTALTNNVTIWRGTWQESRIQAIAYLKSNASAWGDTNA